MPMLGKTGDKAEDTAGGDTFHGHFLISVITL